MADKRTLLVVKGPAAKLLTEAWEKADSAWRGFEAARDRVTDLLSMVAPPGATDFDLDTMTFYGESEDDGA